MTKQIVVLAPNWLGDAVMALPAIRDVRRHFSTAHLTVAARSSVAKLFRAVPGIDEVLTFNAMKDEIAQLQSGSFDVAILLPNSFRSAWVVRRAGIRERWGHASDFRGMLLTKAIGRPKGKVHYGEYYQHLVHELGIETGPLTPQVSVPSTKIQAGATLLRERGWVAGHALVGIAPGAAFGHAKRWPPERFAALATSLCDESDAACVLLGRDDDRDAGQKVEAAVGAATSKRLINLIGQTDLLMLMGVLSHCRALVANDSGALHLAAAMGVPVTAIYGPTDERYSLPLASSQTSGERVSAVFEPVFCRPCGLRDCPIDHRCMKRLPPARVYAVVRQQLQLEAAI
jgi:lipopolysaccharide heptosyltransferase II